MRAYAQLRLRLAVVGVLLAGAAPQAPAAVDARSEAGALLGAYLRYVLVKQVPGQVSELVGTKDPEALQQASAVAADWSAARIGRIRSELGDRFGARARPAFEGFVQRFTEMEARSDAAFLQQMNAAVGVRPPAPNYAELRRQVAETALAAELRDTSQLLGSIETWVAARDEPEESPPLAQWLAQRAQPKATAPSPPAAGTAARATRDPLEAAEGGFTGFVDEPEGDAENPFDAFSGARRERRARILAESEAGMEMVAQERRAWETAHAQKEQAAATQDAAAMQRHAEELAAVEEAAFQQRQRLWGNRLKKLLASAAGSFAGGVTGGFAARATEEAVNEIWP